MANFALNEMLQVVFRWKGWSSWDFLNVYHFICDAAGSFTDAQLETALETWADTVYDSLQTHIISDVDVYDIKADRVVWDAVKLQPKITESILWVTWTSSFPPSGAGEALPTQCAANINLRTERPKTRGRKFIPVFREDDSTSGGNLAAGALADLLLAGAAMLIGFSAGTVTFAPGVMSQYSGTEANFFRYLTATVTPNICTQRRRRFLVGG